MCAVLQVLAFAEHVGGDEHAQLVVRRDLVALVVADRAEAPGQAVGFGVSPVTRPAA